MAKINMTSLVNKLQNLSLKIQHGQEVGYGRALREAILGKDDFMEVEALKSLGDLHLQKAQLSKDSAEFDKAAALYAAALLRCKDPDMRETLEHRIGYMEKLSRQLLQGYSPQYQSPDYWGTADNNVLRVAEICDKLDRRVGKPWHYVEETYTETLVTAIGNSDMFLELEVLKSLGDFYLKKGKTTSDVSQFSKAAAMYNKALRTCGDPETKLTLKHRIRYMDKIRKAAKKKPSSNKQRPGGREPLMGHQLGNITRTDITQDHRLYHDVTREYTDHLAKGDSSLARADLDSAEQHFATALKTVHVKAQQYQREVEPLCKLGDVYSKRGQQTGDGGDFVKAAALYNAAIARSEDQVLNNNIATAIREVEKLFLKCILDFHCIAQDNTEKHKKQLKEMRDQIKLEMETIDQQLDPYVHDEHDPCVREIEAKRAQAVRQLFEKIAQQRKEFISLLVEGCIGLMGPPPCKYALIGLGSQATGLVTPYSDLEFAILVEEESEECLVYFRNLTHYLHLKVVNLGETILPALGIKSLNDFYSENPRDSWYYDSVTPRGFAFDGSMPKASKTPLGRQGTMDKSPSELICTPDNMVSKLQKDVTLYLEKGYHLATILRNPCLIAGDQDLIDTYMDITGKILQADGGKMAQQLAQETLKDNMEIISNKETITARLTDVKKELYRFPAVAVDCLALSSGIIPTTVWKTIEEMENQQVISPNNAHHLTVLTSISAELRLRTYMANGGQKENMSALASMEAAQYGLESSLQTSNDIQTCALIPVFHISNDQQLFRYYYTAVPLKSALQEWSEKESVCNSFPDFYDKSPWVQGMMYYKLCKYKQAIRCYHEAQKKADVNVTEKMEQLLNDIGSAYHMMGDTKNAITFYEQALEMRRSIYGQGKAHSDIAMSLNNLGSAWNHLGDYRKAISYYEQALQMSRSIFGQDTAHPHIAISLSSLGSVWQQQCDYKKAISYNEQALQMFKNMYSQSTCTAHHIATTLTTLGANWDKLGDYKKAISYHEQALQMYRSIYGQTTAHPDIAISLNNLGLAWCHLGDYRKAVSFHKQALQMHSIIYGQSTAHPNIACSLNNLGTAWCKLGDYRTAISYHEQALQMYRGIFGHGTAHSDIAILLNSLGVAWSHLGDYRKVISYHEQALEMCTRIHGQGKAHPAAIAAMTLNHLGEAWRLLGDYRKAISYHEQALQMHRSIHGQATHPKIALSLNNMGEACMSQGDYNKAINYLEQALKMRRSIYDPSEAHPDISRTLNNLGEYWDHMGDYRKAISYHEQALQMNRSIYGQGTEHPDIANSLNNLGMAWYHLGVCKKAVSYHEEALQMYRSMYGQGTEHPDIASSLINLGSAWRILGDYRKAISYYEQALQMFKNIHDQGRAHPAIVTSLTAVGTAWSDLGDYKKAIIYLEQALQVHRTMYGKGTGHSNIATLLHNLGLAWHCLGDHKRALSYFQEALVMARQVFPQDRNHPLIKTIEEHIDMSSV